MEQTFSTARSRAKGAPAAWTTATLTNVLSDNL
jgi:hypothetical protein